MDVREQRLGLNEAVFREVNERIEGISKLFRWSKREPLDLVCECRNATCVQRIEMSQAEYEAVRAEETHFALYPGHADSDIERVMTVAESFAERSLGLPFFTAMSDEQVDRVAVALAAALGQRTAA